MDAKQQKIKEAYGEQYEKYIDYIDTYDGSLEDIAIGQDEEMSVWVLSKCERINQDSFSGFCWRPIQLRNIENNNGWTKIESEADLPKEGGDYWVIQYGIVRKDEYRGDEVVSNMVSKKSWMQRYSHYQPIEKPNPPIY